MELRVRARLVAGERKPYTGWTFAEVPTVELAPWGACSQPDVHAALEGQAFHGRLRRTRSGAWRIPVARAVLERAGVARGDQVHLLLVREARPEPALPVELTRVLRAHPAVGAEFARLAPSMRRAWMEYVAEAKRLETREARAARAIAGIRAAGWPR